MATRMGELKPFRIVVVCKGNICRSPVAAFLINELGDDRIDARSRGLRDWHAGNPAHPQMIEAAKDIGIDLSPHRAAQFSNADAEWCDYIAVVDEATRDELIEKFGRSLLQKLIFLRPNETDVADPYGKEQEAFSECVRIIERSVEKVIEHVLCEARSA